MKDSVHPIRPPESRDAAARHAENVAHIATPTGDGLFYAACARDYDEEICGCPICRQAAQDAAERR